MRSKFTGIALLGALAAAMPAAAHHSFAMFDQKQIVTLQGKVHEFQWTNPHAFLEIDDAKGKRWSLELNSPNNLKRQGWVRSSVKPGDHVTLYVHPLRSGDRGGSFAGVKLADGTVLGQQTQGKKS